MSDDLDLPQPDKLEDALHPRETPMLFGHGASEVDFLSALNSGRLHHAWMITGPKGVGKATLAWRIARFLLSLGGDIPETHNQTNMNVDMNGPVSRRVMSLAEPRLFLCRRPYDDKAKRLKTAITVDEIRKLKSFFTMSAADGGRRVAIIDAADEMNSAAANALLKILEEPPKDTTLLLVAHQPSRLLPTIRSRCRVLRCATLSADDLGQALDQQGSSTDKTVQLAELALGSTGTALQLLNANGLTLYADLVELVGLSKSMDRTRAIRIANACVGRGNEANYALTLDLIFILLARLSRYGAGHGGAQTEAAPNEARMLADRANGPKEARAWAQLSAELTERTNHARAVNLDPSSVILDMLLKIDQTARSS
jgi:DNA polymerase-3 subunit delta'